MRHLILAALCIWSSIPTVTPELTKEQVGRVTHYIHQNLTKDLNYEHAYFVKFTEEECNQSLTNEVIWQALREEDADKIYEKVQNYEIYTGKRMVASSFKKSGKYDLHSEYRLLDPDNDSPILQLLTRLPTAGCAIFYSLFSPCISKCLLSDGNYNIIEKLGKVYALPKDRVFAFGNVFWRDREWPKEVVWNSWRSLDDYIYLLRCTENDCFECFTNGVQQDRCYDDGNNI